MMYSKKVFLTFIGENEICRRVSTILLFVEENGTARHIYVQSSIRKEKVRSASWYHVSIFSIVIELYTKIQSFEIEIYTHMFNVIYTFTIYKRN